MINSYKKLIISVVLAISPFICSGCKSEEEKLIDEGMKKFENADFAGAANYYKLATEKNPKNFTAYIKLVSANACINIDSELFFGDLFKALNYASNIKFPSQNKSVPFIIYQLSADRPDGIKINTPDEISAFDEAIKRNPGNAKLYFGRGLWNYALNKQKDAFDDFSKVISLDKEMISAYLMKSKLISLYMGELDYRFNITKVRYNTIFDFKRALTIIPDNSTLYNGLGDVYSSLSNTESALFYYRKAFETDSENILAILNCAKMETIKGNYDAAAGYYEILIKKFPGNIDYLIDLATKKLMAGKVTEGLYDLERARVFTSDEDERAIITSIIEKNRLKDY